MGWFSRALLRPSHFSRSHMPRPSQPGPIIWIRVSWVWLVLGILALLVFLVACGDPVAVHQPTATCASTDDPRYVTTCSNG
jgi:hypothetical protein